ncbi:MIP1 [Candida jiufengensis]|uniref:MIP1 n=1 Tax=Candida jiufengensis TaxID=497108 RepID=UPI002224C557|nr:MIP1 [Candida jiufengensis]KAI5956828.1 MIP1 [Candida jiufengensis]
MINRLLKKSNLRSYLPSRSFHNVNRIRQQQSLQNFNEEPRINQIGIQYLSNQLHNKLFPTTKTTDYLKPKNPELLEISKKHLKENELLGKKTQITEPININHLPDLVGKSLDEHFYKLGQKSSEPYFSMAKNFLDEKKKLPVPPKNWIFQSGWTRYTNDKEPELVSFPLEDELVFDVEVLYKIEKFPVMATCASEKAWYGWVSPALIDVKQKKKNKIDYNHLIPMNCSKQPKLIIGYNVSYDRARILEEYNIKPSKAFYLDGMSLHVATSGICSRQRPMWQKFNKSKKAAPEEEVIDEDAIIVSNPNDVSVEEDPWLLTGSPNSLANVAKFHCNIDLDKSDREYFASEDPKVIVENFQMLMSYCAKDVDATFKVTQHLFPEFFQKVPHPVSFAALKHLGSLILPTTKKWEKYIDSAELCYDENRSDVTETLEKLANDLIVHIETKSKPPKYQKDPWLNQLNWKLKEGRLRKDGTPYKNSAYLTGYPEWYRELWGSVAPAGTQMTLTLKTRITPLLLKLKWEGYPLFWVNSEGWCFKVPFNEDTIEDLTNRNYKKAKLTPEEIDLHHDLLTEKGKSYILFKVPHPDGPNRRCTLVLSKNYMRYFEDGTLTSEYDYAQKILKLNSEASYWMGNRTRIMDQFVVYNDEKKNKFFETKKESQNHKNVGLIIPNLASMGTITRRATENTWLTASNAKKNRIGSELKSLIEAPKGYCFVGADVDSEELWIASLVGDSMFEIHGGSALGWMTLEGEKSQKTDLHSKTAQILQISRNDAKIFNYGRIYGAGVKFASRLLKQCNPSISEEEADKIARKLYEKTKGNVQVSRILKNSQKFYYGGSESIVFNALESIAKEPEPKTPVLGASITDALNAKNLNKNTYMTSRINWTIQSSGVDYLHLLIISMEYLIEKYGIEARLAITVHDELRYLVKEKDKYLACLLLQISNLWTRAMFCEQLGILEVPQSCAFFSEVDIDKVLRKEVNLDCITPSHPQPIPPGESLNIQQLLDKTENGEILNCKPKPLTLRTTKYQSRTPIIHDLNKSLSTNAKIAKLKLQTSADKDEWKINLRNFSKFLNINEDEIMKEVHKNDKKYKSSKSKKMIEEYDLESKPKVQYKKKQKKRVTKKSKSDEEKIVYEKDSDYSLPPYEENIEQIKDFEILSPPQPPATQPQSSSHSSSSTQPPPTTSVSPEASSINKKFVFDATSNSSLYQNKLSISHSHNHHHNRHYHTSLQKSLNKNFLQNQQPQTFRFSIVKPELDKLMVYSNSKSPSLTTTTTSTTLYEYLNIDRRRRRRRHYF